MATYQVWVWTMSIAPSSFIVERLRAKASDGRFEFFLGVAGDCGRGFVAVDDEVAVGFVLGRPSNGLRLGFCGRVRARGTRRGRLRRRRRLADTRES